MRLVADDASRRQLIQTILAHGHTPDDLLVEDAVVLLDIADLFDHDAPQE